MTAASAVAPRPAAAFGFGIVGLLALAVFINYVDRGNLATAAPLIKDELKLSHTDMGWLLSCFFWTYTPGMLLAGWLQERINAYRTLAIGLALWSLATVLSGFATGFAMLIALRLVLGLGESAAFPCSSKLIAQHLPQHRFGAANGLIGVGLALGPAFGTFVGGLIMAEVGWRWLFGIFGVVSMLWLIPWLFATRHLSRDADADTGPPAPPLLAILKRPEIWGVGLGHFCMNYAFYFVITWLPTYLIKARGFSVPEMAKLGGLIYLVYAASSFIAGWASDRWIRTGGGVNLVRKTFAMGCSVFGAAGMLICAVGDAKAAIAGLFVAVIGFGMGTPTLYAVGQTLAGPRAGGKWMSVQNGLGNIAGITAPVITGFIVDRTGSFTLAFAVASGVALTALIGWGPMIKRVAPIDWAAKTN